MGRMQRSTRVGELSVQVQFAARVQLPCCAPPTRKQICLLWPTRVCPEEWGEFAASSQLSASRPPLRLPRQLPHCFSTGNSATTTTFAKWWWGQIDRDNAYCRLSHIRLAHRTARATSNTRREMQEKTGEKDRRAPGWTTTRQDRRGGGERERENRRKSSTKKRQTDKCGRAGTADRHAESPWHARDAYSSSSPRLRNWTNNPPSLLG